MCVYIHTVSWKNIIQEKIHTQANDHPSGRYLHDFGIGHSQPMEKIMKVELLLNQELYASLNLHVITQAMYT